MAREKFGNTWWGNEWLKALTHIDYENRIPRGAAYARKGAVVEIKVEKGMINAKVQGSRRTPYKVTIEIPQFGKDDIDRLMEYLSNEPMLVSKLMNRELDPRLMQIAETLGIPLFPTRWNDLKMNCSCPDWAVPCKHLAAVVYMMSREIDNDPFTVFTMHGVDLMKELKKRGMASNHSECTVTVPPISDLYKPSTDTPSPYKGNEEFRRIDFTGMTDIGMSLVQLLPENPSFAPQGDFRQTYAAEIARLMKRAKRLIEGKETLSAATGINILPPPLEYEQMQLTINSSLNINNDVDEVLSAFNIDDELADMHPTTKALNQSIHGALHIIAHGSAIPQVVRLGNGYYATIWHPATVDKATRQVVETLAEITPPDLMVWKKSDDNEPQHPGNPSELLLDWLLGFLIMKLSTDNQQQSDLFHFLFHQQDNQFNGVGEKSIPGSIMSWFDRLNIGQHRYSPTVIVSIDGDLFSTDMAVHIDGTPVMFRDILWVKEYADIRMEVLKEASLLSPYIDGFEQYIKAQARKPITLDSTKLATFLMQMVPSMRLLGIKIVLPKELQALVRPRISMTLKKKQSPDGISYLNLSEMLDFDWKVALGDQQVSVAEFRKLTEKAGGLIRFKGQYIYVDAADLSKIDDVLSGRHPVTPYEMLQTALSEEYDGATVTLSDEVHKVIAKLGKQRKLAVPANVKATLRPYQQRGYEWMYRNAQLGFGSILADDMGLGKTLQVITLLQRFKDEAAKAASETLQPRFLVVVPTTLISNWQSELGRFAPKLSCFVYHGGGRDIKRFDADLMLTTYGVARSDTAQLKKVKWHTIVIDEAQNIKNTSTAQSKAIRSLPATNHIAMSGTPIENRMSEFWSIMDFANHGLLGSTKQFKDEYATPIQRWGNATVAERFRKVTAPFLLRRLKTDRSIISDLPDKIEENTYTTLTDRQAALYHETVEEAMRVINEADTSTQQGIFKRQGLVLQMILALKQICNHPSLFLKNGEQAPELSGKTETLLTLLESITASRQKVLVFTQFKEMGDLLAQCIEQRLGEKVLFLHGGCSIKQRKQMVDDFQTRPECRIFILSIKAAGTGLNLTAASHVVHYDLWWNPAVEAQATDRAYRIGQHQNVIVHRFITKETFEEQIDRMIQEKRHLADMTVATGESWIGNLSNEELNDIFMR